MVNIGDLYGDFKTLCKQWFYEKSEVDTALNGKQATLVSGTNIKTVNNQSLLGGGDITIQGGGGGLTFDDIYPIGSIYMSVNSTSPQTLFGGTWQQLTDTFLYASTSADTNSTTATGGEASHTLTASESGQKNLGTITSTGGNHTHKLSSTDTKARYLGTTSDGDGITRSSIKPGTSTAVSNFLKSANVIYRYDGNGSSGNLSVSTTISGSDATSSHNNMPPYMRVFMWKRTA